MAASTAVLTSALVKFAMVIVLVAPVPEAVTPAPTKLSVSAAVVKSDPSSCTVIALPPPPETVIVLVAPVPEAVTPEPTKLIVVAAVDNDEPSSCIVIAVPPLPV